MRGTNLTAGGGRLLTHQAKRLATAAVAILVTGCAALEPVQAPPAGEPIEPTAFDVALAEEYRRLAEAERAEGDYRDADALFQRAELAAQGITVEPEALDFRDQPAEAVDPLAAARLRLDVALIGGARGLTPEAAARAQAMFDCWAQEEEENFQSQDISFCRWRFLFAMREVEAALDQALFVLLANPDGTVGAVTVSAGGSEVALSQPFDSTLVRDADEPPTQPQSVDRDTVQEVFAEALDAQPEEPVVFIVYFVLGTTELTEESLVTIEEMFELVQRWTEPQLLIAGHTDRVGAAALNRRLAVNRARTVRDLLIERGLSEQVLELTAFGEDSPLVPTADGVQEPLNRRVEITVR